MIADIYTRKSTIDNARSLASQEQDNRTDIVSEGWHVGQVFSDPELSASRYARKPRPDFEQLLAHIRTGSCQALVLWEASRGSRNLSEWVGLLELCRDMRIPIRITSHRRTYEAWRRRDWRTLAEEGLDAHDESDKISERVLRGMRGSAAAGRPAGSTAYGYTRVYDSRGHFEAQIEHEEQAAVIRRIFDQVSHRVTLRQIADGLNRRGIPSPKGGHWAPQVVRRLALSRTYLGERVHHGIVTATGCWPALVTEDVFVECGHILTAPERRTSNDATLTHVLTGAAHCDKCESGLLGAKWLKISGRRVRLYGCTHCRSTWVNADYLEDFIEGSVIIRLRRKDTANLFDPPTTSDLTKAAKLEVAKLERLMAGHYETAARGELSPSGLVAMEKLLLPQIEAASLRAQPAASLTFLRGITPAQAADRWFDLPVAHRRTIIRIICEIHVGPGTKGHHGLERSRLGSSRWHGDKRTWGEIWAAEVS